MILQQKWHNKRYLISTITCLLCFLILPGCLFKKQKKINFSADLSVNSDESAFVNKKKNRKRWMHHPTSSI